VVWAIYLRGGLAEKPPEIGITVSRGYWGVLITLAAAALLLWTWALYVREAKRKGKASLVPLNTTFEDGDQRSLFVLSSHLETPNEPAKQEGAQAAAHHGSLRPA
jgi:hypothetical protein